MRFEIKQLDTTNNNKDGAKKVEDDINATIEKIEKAGNVVTGEYLLPQQNTIRSILVMWYEKGASSNTRYSFFIIDNRDSYDVVGKILNAEVIALEGRGRQAVRVMPMPKKNDAYTQFLIAHVPSDKKVKVPTPENVVKEVAVEKPKEEVKENAEKPSEAITA